jgi:2-polyprenyl-6-methoxyphenol hydroxylase-like FAD-dependent oxidoreductase
MRIAVLGAGVAGCTSALALMQHGHEVVVVDRDPGPPEGDADEVFDRWSVPGVAQHRQPHNFLGLGRDVLRDRLPDVYAGLLAAGAGEIDQTVFLGDAPRLAGDEDLAAIACRRPVFDAVLRRALPEIRQREVKGLLVRDGTVTGLELEGETIEADLVVDAGGRTSQVPNWLAESGHPQPEPLSSDCGLLYYSRHYRLREGESFPAYSSVLAGPRGDLGYLAYAVFLGDTRTFCLCLMVPPSDKPFRDLRDPAAFERVAHLLPGMTPWLEVARPATEVLPMGHLRNVLRAPLSALGIIALGDARCHTNPTFAYGASLALAHGVLLADLASKAADLEELEHLFAAEIELDLRARYDAVTAEDTDRARAWGGEPLDVTDPDASMPLYLRSVVYRVCPKDPDLLRAVVRRVNALDPVDLLESNTALLAKAHSLYDGMRTSIPAPPPRSELLDALAD